MWEYQRLFNPSQFLFNEFSYFFLHTSYIWYLHSAFMQSFRYKIIIKIIFFLWTFYIVVGALKSFWCTFCENQKYSVVWQLLRRNIELHSIWRQFGSIISRFYKISQEFGRYYYLIKFQILKKIVVLKATILEYALEAKLYEYPKLKRGNICVWWKIKSNHANSTMNVNCFKIEYFRMCWRNNEVVGCCHSTNWDAISCSSKRIVLIAMLFTIHSIIRI